LFIALLGVLLPGFLPNSVWSGAPGTRVRIDVSNTATVKNEDILVGDLASVHAENTVKNKIENIHVFSSPEPGKEKVLNGKRIASIIRSTKWVPENTRINIPEFVWVKRAFQSIPDTTLKDLLCRYIEKHIGDAEYRLSNFKVQGKKDYIAGKMKLVVRDPSYNGMISGNIKLGVDVMVNGKEQGKIKLYGRVDRFEYAVCAARFIQKGTVLNETNLERRLTNISKSPKNIVKHYDKALNKCLKYSLRPGEFLRQNMLEHPVVIKRGELIKLIARSGLLTVVAYGTAQSDGAVGEQIKVENSDTNRTVVGRVLNESSVLVVF